MKGRGAIMCAGVLGIASLGDAAFSDLRLIDMCELARERRPDGDDVKWVQEYRDDNSALLFTMAQFGRYLEIEELLKKRLSNVEDIRDRVAGKVC